MSKIKTCNKWVFVAFCAFLASALFTTFGGSSVFADTAGIVENGDARWEYVLTGNDLQIKFYDKTPTATTVTVPSLDWLKSNIPGVSADLNTYFLMDADQTAQDANYSPSPARRTATANTTVLDMTNTNKIQILGVQPIIDPDVETELKFGPEMVIGDTLNKRVWIPYCDLDDEGDGYYYCRIHEGKWVDNVEDIVSGWDNMSEEEQIAYAPTMQQGVQKSGCYALGEYTYWVNPTMYATYPCFVKYESYYYPDVINQNARSGGAFAGYKLKLTNFVSSNFNYIGWNAFANTTLNAENTSVTVDEKFAGSFIFRGSNVKNVTINSNNIGAGIFKDCQNIESITFGDGVDTIVEDTFAGTDLTSFDFGAHGIKRIKARAFEGSRLESIDLTGVERLDYRAFKDNDIVELYLPKSINYLQAQVFKGNGHMKKVTVAYDTMTSGTTHALAIVLDGAYSTYGTENEPESTIEEVVVLAPYAADEQVSATHVTMEDYAFHYDQDQNYHSERVYPRYNCGVGYTDGNINYWYGKIGCDNQAIETEKRWIKPDEMKNVIAPAYFDSLHNLKRITVGEGYEYIGGSAFIDTQRDPGSAAFYAAGVVNNCSRSSAECDNYEAKAARPIEKISLPSTLKGVGTLAFGSAFYPGMEVNLPTSLEFIGQGAFKQMYTLENDIDLPNLKFLGDGAFSGTLVRNVYLHDSLEYMGWGVFHDCFGLRDITFDLDVYDPDNMIIWSKTLLDNTLSGWNNYYSSEFHGSFGDTSNYNPSDAGCAEWNLSCDYNNETVVKFGTITFTEKAVHEPNFSYSSTMSGEGIYNINGQSFGSSNNGATFNYMNAQKVDFSATPWKVFHPYGFHHAKVNELILPSNLEVIGTMAFAENTIEKEVILPNTLKIIGDGAFQCTGQGCSPDNSIIITKLPASLEFIGANAFYGDKNLTADLNAPNLRRVYSSAFQRTSLRDVYIPSTVEWLHSGTFSDIPTLRDITIDADFATLVATEETRPDTYQYYPQSLINYADNGIVPAHVMIGIELYRSFTPQSYLGPYETFFSIFGKNMSYRVETDSWPYYRTETGDQLDSGLAYGSLIFTDKNVTELDGTTGIFSGLSFGTVDMGATSWTKITEQPYAFNQANIGTLILPNGVKTINEGAFHDAVIENEFELPATTKTIDRAAFQSATGKITEVLPEGVKSINEAAFYDANMADDLTIPATVEHIGKSAFNAGSQDVHYGTVTIKPALTYDDTDDQLVHQFLWGSSLDKLVIDSSMLPALANDPALPLNQEFWNMDMNEAVVNNLPGISYGAFDSCTNLKTVDMSSNSAIRMIGEEAFVNDEKLDTIKFSPSIKNETITVGSNAFSGTGFTELGDSSTKFDLTAAKFDATPGHSFANMSKLKKVTVPRNFSGATIPEYTFYNDELLEEARVDYKITDIKNAAFARDNNLKRIFIWGDTIIQDQSLDGYTPPTRGPIPVVVGPTIPETTDIYAYSTAKTEDYAASEQRADFAGKFYPLDEVLYLTSNHPTVLLQEDDTDFDKSDLVVYAMRRDGIILESDSWQEFDGNAYARAGKGLNFEHMAETIAENEAFGTIWDTPVPMDELDLTNQNFANLAYLIRPATDDPAVLTVDLKHTDKYTTYLANTNVDPRDAEREREPDPTPDPTPDPEPEPEPQPEPTPTPQPEPQPDTPKTLDEIVKYVAILTGSITAGAVFAVIHRKRS
ncbi:leucine-rich repeat protein [Candidatus Saccharibacteria bacterium]|nr:leucine-rich repeat protein [Candidatus Saccharibacteria bacterium]